MKEEWIDIEGRPGCLISNYGRLFNKDLNKIVNPGKDNSGYFRIIVGATPNGKIVPIHRLVAFAFVDGYFEGAVVNHKDGNKTNNKASNLEWITHGDNVRHAFATGLNPFRRHLFRVIETGDTFRRPETCASYIGGNPASILKCLNGTMKTHKGYTFEYVN